MLSPPKQIIARKNKSKVIQQFIAWSKSIIYYVDNRLIKMCNWVAMHVGYRNMLPQTFLD